MLQSHHVEVTPETLSSQLYIPERKGSLQIEISVAARSFGMLPYRLDPVFADILQEVAAGNPVLVLQNLGLAWWPQWHYAVVIGYNMSSSELIMRSGTTERWITTFDNFRNTWNRADNWALVIVPLNRIPETARLSAYLKTAYAFEETGQTDYALDAYRAATKKWGHDSSTWLMLGNLALQSGQINEAVSSLLDASMLNPESATIWNNLAYALHRQGCKEQALDALRCAYRLEPENQNIADSEYEIKHITIQAKPDYCPQTVCN